MLFDEPAEHWLPPTSFPEIPHGAVVGYDLETKDEGIAANKGAAWPWKGGFIVGIAMAWRLDAETVHRTYLPLRHAGPGNLDPRLGLRWLHAQFRRTDLRWAVANALYDFGWAGMWPAGSVADVQVMAPLLNENRQSYGLGALGKDYLGRGKDEDRLTQYAKGRGWKNPKNHMADMPAHVVAQYAMTDAEVTLLLSEVLWKEIQAQDLTQAFRLEQALQPVLFEMRGQGIRVNVDRAEALGRQYAGIVKEGVGEIRRLTGVSVDAWEAESIAKALRHEGIEPPKTKQGQPSVTKELLASWQAGGSKVATLVSRIRKFDKAKGTFIDGHFLGCQVNGRVHPEFHPLRSEREDGAGYGTVSYRFSCSDPNFQQLPGRDEELTADLRGLCEPEEGETWIATDYSQQEPRMAIHFAEELGLPSGKAAADLLRATSATWDFHTVTAEIVGLPRKKVKTISLGRMYGAGGAGIADLLGLPTKTISARGRTYRVAGEETEAMLETYDEKFPWVKEASDKHKELAERRGELVLLGGYRARFARKPGQPGDFPHKAFNRRVQGSSAAQTKRSMIAYKELTGRVPLVTVHDENGCSGGPRERAAMVEAMVGSFSDVLSVPFRVDVSEGKTWGEAALAED